MTRFIIAVIIAFSLIACAPRLADYQPAGLSVMRKNAALALKIDCPANRSGGSGAVISRSGHVVTAYHVIEGCPQLAIVLDEHGKPIPHKATVVVSEPEYDFAVIKIDVQFDGVIPIAESKSVYAGMPAYAIGYPRFYGLTITFGHVAKPKLTIPKQFMPEENPKLNPVLLFDGRVGPGNSGGPLISADSGALIGLIYAYVDNPPNFGAALTVGNIRLLLDKHNISYDSETSD